MGRQTCCQYSANVRLYKTQVSSLPKSPDLKAHSSLIDELFPAEQARSNTGGGDGITSNNKLGFSHPLNEFKVNADTTTKKMQCKLFYLNVHFSCKETKYNVSIIFLLIGFNRISSCSYYQLVNNQLLMK